VVSSSPLTEDKTVPLGIVDLFCGVGGLSLGSSRAGFAVRGAIDVDPKTISAHSRNFPNTIHLSSDIAGVRGQSLKRRLGLNRKNLAGIIGGPPCQGFSSIGKRDRFDVRNKLFVEFFRVVSEAMPTFFLAENVPGIMRESYRDAREQALSLVEGKYTILPPMELAANEYGAATTRKRVFFFGYLPDRMESLTDDCFKATPEVEQVYVRDALQGLPTKIDPGWQTEEQSWRVVEGYGDSKYARMLHGHIPVGVGDESALQRLDAYSKVSGFLGTRHTSSVAERYANTERGKHDCVSKSYRLDPNGFCPTLRAGTGPDQGSFQAVRPIHPTEARVITPREAARLQGFPDWFQFSPTKWHSFRQIGNSVSPILAEQIFVVIAKALGATPRMGESVG
jgi:DNA (cytosine-5)-methyltransferase 1